MNLFNIKLDVDYFENRVARNFCTLNIYVVASTIESAKKIAEEKHKEVFCNFTNLIFPEKTYIRIKSIECLEKVLIED